MEYLRALLFSILIPGTISVYIPHYVIHHKYISLGAASYLGILIIFLGIMTYLSTVIKFLTAGKGTPAIWFTKFLKPIIGEEPIHLVSSGLYKHSRNPMYIGVLLCILGQGLYFENQNLLLYTPITWLFFHLVVIYIEEPHLKNKFGESYINYLNTAPRWF